MPVNLLEKDRLVYHDTAAHTLTIKTDRAVLSLDVDAPLTLEFIPHIVCDLDRDAVETLRNTLTCWLETGKLK